MVQSIHYSYTIRCFIFLRILMVWISFGNFVENRLFTICFSGISEMRRLCQIIFEVAYVK